MGAFDDLIPRQEYPIHNTQGNPTDTMPPARDPLPGRNPMNQTYLSAEDEAAGAEGGSAPAGGNAFEDLVPQTREVGPGESFGRRALRGLSWTGRKLGLALGAPLVIGEKIRGAITGDESTPLSDLYFKHMVEPFDTASEALAPQPGERYSLPSQWAGLAGEVTGQLPEMVGGGAAAGKAALTVGPRVLQQVGGQLARGFVGAQPTVQTQGIARLNELRAQGVPDDVAQSIVNREMARSGIGLALPMGIGGGLTRRFASGAAVGGGLGVSQQAATNAQLAEAGLPTQPITGESIAEQAALGAILSGIFGPPASKLGLKPPRQVEAPYDINQNIVPPSDRPLADVIADQTGLGRQRGTDADVRARVMQRRQDIAEAYRGAETEGGVTQRATLGGEREAPAQTQAGTVYADPAELAAVRERERLQAEATRPGGEASEAFRRADIRARRQADYERMQREAKAREALTEDELKLTSDYAGLPREEILALTADGQQRLLRRAQEAAQEDAARREAGAMRAGDVYAQDRGPDPADALLAKVNGPHTTREGWVDSVRALGEELRDGDTITDHDTGVAWTVRKGTSKNGMQFINFETEGGQGSFYFTRRPGEENWRAAGDVYVGKNSTITRAEPAPVADYPSRPIVPGEREAPISREPGTRADIEERSARGPTPEAARAAREKQAMLDRLDVLRAQRDALNDSPRWRDLRRRRDVGDVFDEKMGEELDRYEQQHQKLSNSIFDLESRIYQTEGRSELGTKATSGVSDRPFRAPNPEDAAYTGRLGGDALPGETRGQYFQRRAEERFQQAYQERLDRLEAEWRERERMRQERAQQRQQNAEDRAEDRARRDYEGANKKSFGKEASKDADGRFTTDQYGHVMSTQGGPVYFKHQRDAGWWILKRGNKESPDQIFEIANHPAGHGFTVRQSGRAENASASGKQQGSNQQQRPGAGARVQAIGLNRNEPPGVGRGRAEAGGGDRVQQGAPIQPQAEAPRPGGGGGESAGQRARGAKPKKERRPVGELLKAIKRAGGIHTSFSTDILGESARHTNRRLPGLFGKNGKGLDELVEILNQHGWFNPRDLEDVDGGVGKLADMIRQDYNAETEHGFVGKHKNEEARAQQAWAEHEQAQADRGEEFISDQELRDAMHEESLPHTEQNADDIADVEKAKQYDPDAVERIQEREMPDDEYMARIRDIIDAHEQPQEVARGERTNAEGDTGGRQNPPEAAGEEAPAATEAGRAGAGEGATGADEHGPGAAEPAGRGEPEPGPEYGLRGETELEAQVNDLVKKLDNEIEGGFNALKGNSPFQRVARLRKSLNHWGQKAMAAEDEASLEKINRAKHRLEQAWDEANTGRREASAGRTEPEFSLTGSNRAADANPNQRDIFAGAGQGRREPGQNEAEGRAAYERRRAEYDRREQQAKVEVERRVAARRAELAADKAHMDKLREDVLAKEEPPEEAPKEEAKPEPANKGGGGTLYSGLPLDQIAKAFKWLTGDTEHLTEGMRDIRDTFKETRLRGYLGTRTPLLQRYIRQIFDTSSADIRGELRRWNSPTANKLVDEMHNMAGAGRGTKETFGDAVEGQANIWRNRVSRALADLSPEAMKQAVAQVRSGKITMHAAQVIKDTLDQALSTMKQAGVDIGEVRNYFPRQFDLSRVIRDPEAFKAALEQAYKETGAAASSAKAMAQSLHDALMYGSSNWFDAAGRGSSAPFLKERVFGPQVDQAAHPLNKFLVDDPVGALASYFQQAAHRTEIAKRFGDKFSHWDQGYRDANGKQQPSLVEQMRKEGAAEIIPKVKEYLAHAAGVNAGRGSAPGAGTKAAASLRTWGSLMTMPLSMLSSIPETLMPGIRSGRVLDVAKTLGHTLDSLFVKSENAQARKAYAEDIGAVADHMMEGLQHENISGGAPLSSFQNRVLRRFYRGIGLTPLTNAQITSAVHMGRTFVRRLAEEMQGGGGKLNERYLRDLGIPAGKEKEFAQWVRDTNDGMPEVQHLKGEMGQMYRGALRRFGRESIQQSQRTLKPAWHSHPLGAVLSQLQGFQYALWENMWKRNARMLKEAANPGESYNLNERARLIAPTLLLPLLYAASYAVRSGRDVVTKNEEQRKKLAGAPTVQKVMRHFSAATPVAPLEAFGVFNALTGGLGARYAEKSGTGRYEGSFAQSFLGPAAGKLTDLADTGARAAFSKPTKEPSNYNKRQLTKQLYDTLVEPTIQMALGTTPASNVARLAAPLMSEPITAALAGKPKAKKAAAHVY